MPQKSAPAQSAPIDRARAYGYEAGSAITQMLKRLQAQARSKPTLAARMARIEAGIEGLPSCLKR